MAPDNGWKLAGRMQNGEVGGWANHFHLGLGQDRITQTFWGANYKYNDDRIVSLVRCVFANTVANTNITA